MLKTDILSKTEKISAAIYLVTSFFDDKEPWKWRLRSLSADLISGGVKDKSITVKEIVSLFSVAKTASLVSETNCNILVQELSRLEQDIEKPLELMFFREMIPDESILPEPQKVESIKDKTNERLSLKEFGAVSIKKNTRQNIIIAILKRKKEIMIKDVSPLISGCSEKTIQRELSTMVQTGILRKTGEKRWSRYSLA